MDIKQEFDLTVTSPEQFKELCSMLITVVGPSPKEWRFRKRLDSGEKNTGRRTRIRKQLAEKGKVDLIIEVFNEKESITNEDLLALRLKY